jgi:nucleoside-diphosphate-sugar epimerase
MAQREDQRFGGHGVETLSEIIGMMRTAAAKGQSQLDEETLEQLRGLTRQLGQAKPEALGEHARFLAIGQRGLCLPEEAITDRVRDRTVLVTGGTGCIGSTLMAQLAVRGPRRLVSVSRGVSDAWPRPASAEYRHADVRDRAALDQVIGDVRPDIIFHVAAQRSPALAEVEVHRTVSTNVLGTRNVLAAAASTGKALRPYSPEVYTASKRAAEWIASGVAARGELLVSAGRFTHVLDNSIVHQRLLAWADGGVIRLHSPDIAFYVQSALESAHLLLVASLGVAPGQFRVHAITDLGWPVSLLDVALGVLAQAGSPTPIYFSGYDPGYEEVPFPGLYDPATAGDVSPLLNAFEAAAVTDSPCPAVDAFRLGMMPSARAAELLAVLDDVCGRTEEPGEVRAALNDLSWALLDAALGAAPRPARVRAAALAHAHRDALSPDHRRVLEAIAASGEAPDEAARSLARIPAPRAAADSAGGGRDEQPVQGRRRL